MRDRIADLVVEMANENQSWGDTRIRDALHNLGITVDRNTVKRILKSPRHRTGAGAEAGGNAMEDLSCGTLGRSGCYRLLQRRSSDVRWNYSLLCPLFDPS